jgi:hypothetical protein
MHTLPACPPDAMRSNAAGTSSHANTRSRAGRSPCWAMARLMARNPSRWPTNTPWTRIWRHEHRREVEIGGVAREHPDEAHRAAGTHRPQRLRQRAHAPHLDHVINPFTARERTNGLAPLRIGAMIDDLHAPRVRAGPRASPRCGGGDDPRAVHAREVEGEARHPPEPCTSTVSPARTPPSVTRALQAVSAAHGSVAASTSSRCVGHGHHAVGVEHHLLGQHAVVGAPEGGAQRLGRGRPRHQR